ncbi:MAG: hypothetical protein GY801_47915 [bacterium]|nr:hypothetical protein [bacterium]
MTQQDSVDVLIIGSGPAGMSVALHLMQADPGWAKRILVVEKAVHPREKLCAGGVTQPGENILSHLGLPFAPIHFPVREMRIVCQHRIFAVRDDPVFRVVRREEFDRWLVQYGERKGITVRQGEAVKDLTLRDGYVEVHTERTVLHAKMVVAADGSNSIVRHKLKLHKNPGKARTLEVLTPETEGSMEFSKGIVEYDFTSSLNGLQGYSWNFPCIIQGKPFMSRGIFDSGVRPKSPRIPLKEEFQRILARQNQRIEDYELKGFPIQRFDSGGIFARPHILFAGDAAGADPLLGEGVAFALAYGQVAAAEIIHAFARQNFTCFGYKKRIMAHSILQQLRERTRLAHVVYRVFGIPWLSGKIWDTAPFIFHSLVRCMPQFIPIKHPRMIRITK